MMTKTHKAIRMICEGALMVVLAQVLDFFPLWKMPWGGSISLNMVPMIFFACRWGLGAGLLSGFVFGVVQFMYAGGIALGWQSILGDYLVAYTALGLAGLFTGKNWSIYASAAVGCTARFLVHYVVGATIWAEYMPEVFFGMIMTTPWFYSLLYNGAYMLPSTALCYAVYALLHKSMKKYFVGDDLK